MRKGFLLIGALAVVVMFFASQFYLKNKTSKPLPILTQVPGFNLTDAQNQKIQAKDLKGNIWVVNFIFTSCGGPCPMLTQKMALIQKRFHHTKNFKSVSLTVDPETDVPSILKDYSKKYLADLNKWYFLTGDSQDIQDLMVKGFKIGHAEKPIFHSNYFVLVDKNLKIRGYYQGDDTKAINQLQKDIQKLITQDS